MCCSLFLLNSYLFTENVLGKTQEKGNSGTLLTNFLVEAGYAFGVLTFLPVRTPSKSHARPLRRKTKAYVYVV